MINERQNERMIAKVAALKDFYEAFAIVRRTSVGEVLFYQKRDGEPAPAVRAIRGGERWGGDYMYGIFSFSLEKEAVLEIANGALENTVFCNGAPVGLTDYTPGVRTPSERLHRYIRVPAGDVVIEGYAGHTYFGTMPREEKQTFFFNGYSPERTYTGIYAVEFDEALKEFNFLLELLNSYYRDSSDVFFHAGLVAVYEAILRVMPLSRRPSADEIADGRAVLDRFFASLKSGTAPYVAAVGHSHLDTAWLWPVAETVRKAARTASNAVALLKKYPDYTFVMSSALYYDWFKKYFPALYADIRTLVREGRFEITAGWVECDCNLTGAEALCRQFARGARFFQAEFGRTAQVFWLPDTFGYSAALPQIMLASGAKYFLTTKLSWNDTNKFPYDTFDWAGLDGSMVRVHFNSTHTRLTPESVSARAAGIAGKHYAAAALMAYGYGDGGGGPSEDMVREALLTERYPHAKVEHSSVQAFMAALPDGLPAWHGELYLELHRGTLTSRHDLKKLNRALETALHTAELVGALTDTGKALTDRAYDTLMLNQFHDILPGTSIARVNDEAEADLREALKAVTEYLTETAGEGERPFNPLSFPYAGAVLLSGTRGAYTYAGADGKPRSRVRVKVPTFGSGEIVAQGLPPVLEGRTVKTPFYTAVLGDYGIESLVYGDRELADGALGTLYVGEDLPLQWDSWDIDADQIYKRRPLAAAAETHFTCGDALIVRQTFPVSDKTTLTRDIVFSAAEPMIRFDSAVDWNDDHTLLTVEFETTMFSPQVRSEVQFGFIDRSVYDSTAQEQAAFEYVNHRWSELREDKLAFTLLNDCKYGVHCRGSALGLSLIKSGTHPDERGERGMKTFSYAICPHSADTAETVRMASVFNAPPLFAAKAFTSPFTIDSPAVVCETVKTAEAGGIALRLYECTRSHAACRLRFNEAWDFYESDIPELNLSPLGSGRTLDLRFRPFEIKTLVIKPKGK